MDEPVAHFVQSRTLATRVLRVPVATVIATTRFATGKRVSESASPTTTQTRELSQNRLLIERLASSLGHVAIVVAGRSALRYNHRQSTNQMTLAAGTRLGTYEIIGAIGSGGMGEVYRARDTRLHRDVAVKVLPQAVAADPDRLARFEREARVLASLNHPHIAQIHGLEQSGTALALVMELVEGEDLAVAIARGPIPLRESMAIAVQIATALEAAHGKGIVHRDLKPANIRLTATRAVKVLDFGLAKPLESTDGPGGAAGVAPTVTSAATRIGVVLGTAAYMAPEQAKGVPVDKRADIWAFGCVLFEMLTARAPFPGATSTEVVAAILEREPDWPALPAQTPVALRRLLKRCLHKDPDHRLHDIADARIELEEIGTATSETAAGPTHSTRPRLMTAAAVTLIASLAAGALGWFLRPSSPASEVPAGDHDPAHQRCLARGVTRRPQGGLRGPIRQ